MVTGRVEFKLFWNSSVIVEVKLWSQAWGQILLLSFNRYVILDKLFNLS